MKTTVLAFVFVVCATTATAQTTVSSGQGILASMERVIEATPNATAAAIRTPETPRRKKKESFFGPTNMILGGLQFGAAGLDLWTTFDCVGRTRTVKERLPGGWKETIITCQEDNPRMADAIVRGWGPATGRKFVENAPIWVSGHLLRRSDHKFFRVMGWGLPILATGWQLKDSFDNHKLIKKQSPS